MDNKTKLTAIILSKNEERDIALCIQSVSFCNEVIVIDDNSTDETATIAKKYGAKVYTHALENDFAKQRNFGLTKASNDWVLFVDADERVTPELQKEIMQTLKNPTAQSFYIKRVDNVWGKTLKHGEVGNIYFLRLAQKHIGVWVGKVHESWVSESKAGELKNYLLHFPHVSIREFLQKINFYSTIQSREFYDAGASVNWFTILAYPTGKFLQNYLLRLGFLDGIPGLILAIMMSFHSFLVRSKLWQLQEKSGKTV